MLIGRRHGEERSRCAAAAVSSIKAEEFWQEHAHADNNSVHSNDHHIKYVVKMEAKKGRLALANLDAA